MKLLYLFVKETSKNTFNDALKVKGMKKRLIVRVACSYGGFYSNVTTSIYWREKNS